MGDIVFYGISLLVILSAVSVVISPKLVHSAVSLLFTLFGVAALYVFLYADFIAATQVIIYVGGILVLIIFGVMLTNKIDKSSLVSSSTNQVLGTVITMILLGFQLGVIFTTDWKIGTINSSTDTVNQIGHLLLNEYLLAFEVISLLLLAALIGSAMLSRKN